ncbi:hypothetical protein ACFWB0_03815 [Rhodococcus sp. NPDC060086]|uniref:hypothetical protein n=1 Tax=Rhodococcus sp. NPDC060086 TaxID=3347055 RepID=UPI0036608F08
MAAGREQRGDQVLQPFGVALTSSVDFVVTHSDPAEVAGARAYLHGSGHHVAAGREQRGDQVLQPFGVALTSSPA